MNDKLPGFIFIGPDKTGSTWMYEILRQHPQCYVPRTKDLYFFDRYYELGLDWYARQFREARPAHIMLGELSHDYLFSDLAATRILSDLPGVKLVTCLRDPVERTFSHYLYLRRNGLTRLPLLEAIPEFPELISNSMYSSHLPRFLDRFPGQDILVMNFADLQSDSRKFAAQLFHFLGLDYVVSLDYDSLVLGAAKPRSWVLARGLKAGADIARRAGLASLVGMLKSSVLRKIAYKTYSAKDKPIISPVEETRLRDIFCKEQVRLNDLLRGTGVEFEFWKY